MDALLYRWVASVITARQGAVFDEAPLHVNLLGVRGLWHRQRVPNSFNAYNDTIFACWLDAFGVQCADSFEASCDPGKLDPGFVNPRGIAHLVEGQWWFKRGLHHDVRALVQSRPVTVARFLDGAQAQQAGLELPAPGALMLDTGYFGINIHAGGTGPTVGNWSAGCQVLVGGWTGEAWKRLDELLYVQADPTQTEIPYTLIDTAATTPP